jgi:predicted permease
VLLLIGAALMIQTYSRLRNIELGFKPEGLLTMRTSVTLGKDKTPEQGSAFFQEALNRVRALTGVESAGYVDYLPFTGGGSKGFFIQGRPDPEPGTMPLALFRPVSDGYFETLQIPLIKGRYFDRTDGPSSHVVIINAAAARKFWPDEDPLGKQIVIPNLKQPGTITIVGVVADVKETRVDANSRPALYLSYRQCPQPKCLPADLAVRTSGNPSSLASSIREQILAVDGNQPISAVMTMDEIIDSQVKDRRTNTLLLGLLAWLAIIQAMLGIYGVVASTVSQRTREIGVRMALGATSPDILRTFLGGGIGLVLFGVAIGLGSSFALTRYIASLLYGVNATDPITFAAASISVILVATVAICVPARRAMKVDPRTALRLE